MKSTTVRAVTKALRCLLCCIPLLAIADFAQSNEVCRSTAKNLQSPIVGAGTFAAPSTRGARATYPATFHLRTNQPIILELHRGASKVLKEGGRLVVSYRTDSGPFIELCDTGVLSPQTLEQGYSNEYRLTSPKNVTTEWRFEVFNLADGGPTDDRPYLIELIIQTADGNLTGKQVTREGYTPQLGPLVPADKRTVPTCASVTHPFPPRGEFAHLLDTSLSVLGSNVPHVVSFLGARNLYLRASSPKGEARLRLLVSAKWSDDGIFYPLCQLSLTPAVTTGSTYAAASVPFESFSWITWRIEAYVLGADNTGSVMLEATVDRDPLQRTIFAPGSIPPSSQYLCQANAHFKRFAHPGGESAFVLRSGLAISLQDPDHLLDATARDWASKEIVSSLATWRQACQDCNRFNMAAVKVDQHVFMLEHLVEWLRAGRPKAATGPMQIPQFGDPVVQTEGLAAAALQNRSGMRGMPNAYMELSNSDDALHNLCTTPSNEVPPSIKDAWLALGCSQQAAAPLALLVQNRRTACGDDPNIVACETDRSLIELNGADYTFQMGTSRVGRGRRLIDGSVVLGHETGHWIDVGHVESEEGLMSESLQTARCIDDATAQALDAVARGEVPRQPGSLALYFENPRK